MVQNLTMVGLTGVAVVSGLARAGLDPDLPLPTPFCRTPLLVCPTLGFRRGGQAKRNPRRLLAVVRPPPAHVPP